MRADGAVCADSADDGSDFPRAALPDRWALEEFPERGDRRVTVGLTAMPGIDGLAVAEEMPGYG